MQALRSHYLLAFLVSACLAPEARGEGQPLNGGAQIPQQVGYATPGGDAIPANQQLQMIEQVGACWLARGGSSKSPAVAIRAHLKPSGVVGQAEVVDSYRYAVDGRFRKAADVALAAVLDPSCQPFDLPWQTYSGWSEIVFTFGSGS